jgi:SAM-dependent methyltransferase
MDIPSHFDVVAVADRYHGNFFISDAYPYKQWQNQIILDHLELKPRDRVADIGGGTGYLSNLMYTTGNLVYPVLCVDPSEKMLEQAKKLDGVDTLCGTVETLVQYCQSNNVYFDKILMKEMIHYIPYKELSTLFQSLHKVLNSGGVVVINTRPSSVDYPFFEAAKENFGVGSHSIESLRQVLEQIFSVTIETCEKEMIHPLSDWIDFMRNKYWSNFRDFTEQEIEDGIEQVKKMYGNEQTIVKCMERYLVIRAEKR